MIFPTIHLPEKQQKLVSVDNNEEGWEPFHIASGKGQWQSQNGKQKDNSGKLKTELPCGLIIQFCVYIHSI